MASTEMDGGEAIVRAAIANGVDTVFGIPGAQIYPIFDALQRLGVRTIVTRHEQGAAYMAMGYAKATGKPGAFAVVPGPGVLNTTAALCTAMGTCTPVLCLTGQVPSQYLGSGRGHLHELPDQTGTLSGVVKSALHIASVEDASRSVNAACAIMRDGRPGPVSVEMCWDTMASRARVDIETPVTAPPLQLDMTAVREAVDILATARKPMLVCGAGAQHASAQVQALAELLQAPVTAFRSGRGIVAEDHPLGVSSVAARALFEEVDVLVGIGSRLEMVYMRWRDMMQREVQPAGGPRLIRIDIDAGEFSRLQPEVGIHGDAALACEALVDALRGRVSPDARRLAEIDAACQQARAAITQVQPQMAYLHVIREVLPRDGFFVPELSQMGFTSYFGFPVYEPRTYVTEGYQGTLGFGLQTALGVKTACPDRPVVCVTGDGGLMFGIQELATAVQYGIGVVTLVFNNHAYGNVRRDQLQNFAGRLAGADLRNPDFVALARSFGADGYRVETPEELRPVLSQAIANDRPAIIEVVTPTGSEASPWPYIHMAQNPLA